MAMSLRRSKETIQLLTRFLNSLVPISSRSLQTLAYEEVRTSSDDRPFTSTAFVLHGLLGSGRNWRSFSRSLSSTLSNSSSNKGTVSISRSMSYFVLSVSDLIRESDTVEWRMVLVDLRNHGKSAELQGFEPPHDMFNAAKDLANLIKSQSWLWPDVVIGHSMGGKVALQFAESCARGDYGESALLPKQVRNHFAYICIAANCVMFQLMNLTADYDCS